MDIPGIDGAQYFGAKPAKPKSELDMHQFMRLLTVQLTNQNPLEPMNDRDFFAQMAQLGTVQGMDQLKGAMEVTQASSLMGRRVTASRPMTDASNNTGQNMLVDGIVVKMSVRQGKHYLGVMESDGGVVDVEMRHIQTVQEF